MARGVPREQWEKRVEKENKRREERAKQLKDTFGYEYTPSTLKSVDDVPKPVLSLEDQEQQKLLAEIPAEEDAIVVEDIREEVREKKKRKSKAKDGESKVKDGEPKTKKRKEKLST